MKRWNNKHGKNVENPKIDAFLKDIVGVYKKHGLAITHEDNYGAFGITKKTKDSVDAIMDAFDDTDIQR